MRPKPLTQDQLLGLAHQDQIDRQLLQDGARRGRAMGPDRDQLGHGGAERRGEGRWQGQLGLGAAPEQIGRRRGDHRDVRAEGRDVARQLIDGLAAEMAVQEQNLVAVRRQQGLGIAQLERQMRLAAAEIDAAGEAPGRIDQGNFHASSVQAVASNSGASAPPWPWCLSQWSRR